jgi:tRNA threonylcarbamoyladenosine biosynthesis protein TsaB
MPSMTSGLTAAHLGAHQLGAPFLAIETSGSACSVALRTSIAPGHPPAHEFNATSHGHATLLMPMIERLALATGIDLAALGGIAVSCGPGSFTGIRVGLATARAMALAIGCPIVGIGTFQALAATVARSAGPLAQRNLVVLDSRRQELFAQELDANLNPLAPATLRTAEEIAARCQGDGPGGGPDGGVALIADAELAMLAPLNGRSGTADAIAVADLAALRPDLHTAAEPIYLRPPDVSQPRARTP